MRRNQNLNQPQGRAQGQARGQGSSELELYWGFDLKSFRDTQSFFNLL